MSSTKSRSNLEKSESFLTNPKYKQVLQILLTSREPLSISEILKQMEKPNDKDVYRIIKALLPTRDNPNLLVRWDKIPSNDRWYKYQFLKLLNIVKARLGDTTKQGYLKYVKQDIDDGNIISYEKSADDKNLSIYYGGKIIAKFNIEQTKFPTLEIYTREIDGERKKTYPLILKNKNNKIYLYIETISKKPIKYLFASSIDDTSKSIYEYEKSFSNDNNYFNRPKFANFYDISELTHDRVNWKYRCNIRGLLLFVLLVTKNEKERGGRAHDAIINKVLRNLSANYFLEFPCLEYYKECFEQEFEKLANIGFLPKGLYIKLIKEIAEELQNVLEELSAKDLVYKVTKRFYDSLNRYFGLGIRVEEDGLLLPPASFYGHKLNEQTYKRLIKYLYDVSAYLGDVQSSELSKIKNESNRYLKFYYLKSC